MPAQKPTTTEAYIAAFPTEVQARLQLLRKAIRKAAPDATETISYGMPAFAENGVLVYFAAYRNHIGFYPTASGIRVFKDELRGYVHSKGAVQFPLDAPLPLALITRIVKHRLAANKAKAVAKRASRLKLAPRGSRAPDPSA